jgi:hypothetical protein
MERFQLSRDGWVMAEFPREQARHRAVDPHICEHSKLIAIWKYKRFPDKTLCKCLVCGREMVTTRLVSSRTETPPPDTTRQESNSRRL